MQRSLCFVLCLCGFLAQGQLMYDWENRAENFHYRVKNIEFFIDRFNNQPEGSGSARAANPKDTAACIAFMKERDQKVFSLFDLAHLDKKDAALKERVNTFFRDINNPYQPRFIRFEDMYWFAELIFVVQHGAQKKKLRCVMQVMPAGKGVLVWAIRSFHAADLKVDERFRTSELYFPPSVNGTDFMNVRLALNDPAWVNEKLKKQDSSRSATLRQFSSGDLKIEMIERITYHFLQLEGWIMTVNYVNRESKNSGWLIDRLWTATRQEKVNYLKELSVD